MANIKFTSALSRFFPNLKPTKVGGSSMSEVLDSLDTEYPGLINYILDDHGMLRKHVNLFVNGEILKDRNNLDIPLTENSEVYIIQALSGG